MRVSFIPALWLLSITATSAAGPPQVKLDMSKFETALADYFVDQKADSHATLEAKLVEKTITFCKNV
jgi:glutaredoxin 2